MPEPKPYLWDYDRNTWDESDLASTFSVGVYQWLPKASGGGLKKSKSIRINGFTADALRVYLKAQELCDRLNAEEARADQPPLWLRKQYSLPRPDASDPPPADEPESRELTGDQARALRLQVMKRRLLPEGFVKARGGAYVRAQGDALHLVDFQADTRGHRYTVNLGFHYRFVPSYSQGGEVSPADLRLLDCALSARLGYFGPEAKDEWLEYGDDRERLTAALEQNARDCLAVFDRCRRDWPDPEWWLERIGNWAAPTNETLWVGPWHVRWPELFAGAIALHLGRHAHAEAHLTELLSRADPTSQIHRTGRTLLERTRKLE